MVKRMWDAANPPASPPAGYDAAAGYIGGDTPHVWTVGQWRQLGKLPKLPIFVRSNPPADATHARVQGHADAWRALEQLHRIGCPPGRAVAYDLEQAVNAPLVTAFNDVMSWAGFRVWPYGARSFIFRNPACAGRWVADYLDPPVPHMVKGAAVRSTQYRPELAVPGGTVDVSLVKWWSWRWRLWR